MKSKEKEKARNIKNNILTLLGLTVISWVMISWLDVITHAPGAYGAWNAIALLVRL